MRCVAVALLAFTVAACTQDRNVVEKEKAWVDAANVFLAQPRTLGDIHAWLRTRNVYYTFDDADVRDGTWRVGLDKIYVESLLCEAWSVYLTVQIAPDGAVLNHSVATSGQCL
jgi:hypothetical protein